MVGDVTGTFLEECGVNCRVGAAASVQKRGGGLILKKTVLGSFIREYG